MTLIAPSILSADFSCLGTEIIKVEQAGADWLHIDVMDGHFVPNITIGPGVVKDIKKETSLFIDVHLMIARPEYFIPQFIEAGADMITVHLEACVHLHRIIEMIKRHGVLAGVAINPATPASALEAIIKDVDLVLVMSVNPGFGGQKFIPGVLPKIRLIRKMLDESYSKAYLQVDGGINQETAHKVIKAGCNVLVAGSYIFRSHDINKAITNLKNRLKDTE